MPTENRSSNTEQMDNVPKITPEGIVKSIKALLDLDARGSLAPHGIGGLARDLLTKCSDVLSRPATQHQGEPVAYQWRRKTVHEGSQWLHWADCTEEDYRKTIENPGPTSHGVVREARKLYTRADPNVRWKAVADEQVKVIETLRARLTEHDALLKRQPSFIKALEQFEVDDGTFVRLSDVLGALSASAGPINDLCAEGAHEFVPFRSECVKCGEPYSAEPEVKL